MYWHIERVKFISINVDRMTFVKLVRDKKVKHLVELGVIPDDVLGRVNEFVRFKYQDDYIDKGIKSLTIDTVCTIFLGKTIDCSVPARNEKNINFKK